jgi:hypothetical protein
MASWLASRRSYNIESPTRQGHGNVLMAPDDEEAELYAKIIALLQSEDIELKGWIKLQLRQVIRRREMTYEAEIYSYEEEVKELRNELAKNEGGGSLF